MDFLKRFQIRNILGSTVALLAIILLSNLLWVTFTVYLPEKNLAENLGISNKVADQLLAAAAEQAKERGFTKAYLSTLKSGGQADAIRQRIIKLREQGDAPLTEALQNSETMVTSSFGTKALASAHEALQQALEEVRRARRAVDDSRAGAVTIEPDTWVQKATALIEAEAQLRLAAFLPQSELGMAQFQNTSIKQALWLASEYAGRERATFGGLTAAGRPLDEATRVKLAGFRGTVERNLAYVGVVNRLTQDAEGTEEFRKAWRHVEETFLGPFQRVRENVYAASYSGDYPISTTEWLRESTTAINTLLELSKVVGRNVAGHVEEAGSDASVNVWRSYGLLAIVLLLAVASLLVVRYVSRRIGIIRDMVVLIEKERDLSRRLVSGGKDELCQLSGAFNQMMEKFSGLLGDVIGSAGKVATALGQVSGAAGETERGMQAQNSELAQAATAMNQMSATVQEMAQNIAQASDAAESANGEAEQGRQVVHEVVDAINHLAQQVESAVEVVSRVESDSVEIGRIVEVINGIAEQTNLLALNASIEAARAGEQGRGFAVVADEVRNLAHRTRESTEEIDAMIERLHDQVREAVATMQAGHEGTKITVERTANAGMALERIVEAVTTIRDMNHQIATAAEEQSQVAGEIDRNLTNVSGQADSTLNTSGETVTATAHISDEMEQMRQAVSSFKLTGGLDLSAAKIAHQAWKGKLRSFLDGTGNLSRDEALSHHECALGKWYYGEGLAKYAHLSSMRELEVPHKELHQTIHSILDYRENGRHQTAEQEYERVESLSDSIVALLEAIEGEALAAEQGVA